MASADVMILGETHDNPGHHLVQAEVIASLAPAAIVYEMLTPEQAALVTPELAADPEELRGVLDWDRSGWPDFALYAPVFAAYPAARVYGAQVTRQSARKVLEQGASVLFGDEAGLYGLDQPLPKEEQSAREAMQMAAHCDALPVEMLPGMVEIQRFRDAVLAQTAISALLAHGAPVVIVTGNGHARRDWGIPVYLSRVRPEAEVFVLGQAEEGATLGGAFDTVISAPPAQRPDPCRAFRTSD
jgi:uncharacterized iron-regulated protein